MDSLENKIDFLNKLGQSWLLKDPFWDVYIQKAIYDNPWFTLDSIHLSLSNLANQFCEPQKLIKWAAPIIQHIEPKNLGIVMAGNIPLVGFSDWLAVFLSPHTIQLKLSDKDTALWTGIFEFLSKFNSIKKQMMYVTFLKKFDAVIATGSNTSSMYFESYFKNVPHIIRKSRTSVAYVNGNESTQNINNLGHDIFNFYGLGCRNVSKIYLPEKYPITYLLEQWESFRPIIDHTKYANNFEYSQALYLMNLNPFLTNGHLILLENENIFSRISCVHYEYIKDEIALSLKLKEQYENIQCIVSEKPIFDIQTISMGSTQKPSLSDYPDHINIIQFINGLSDITC